MSAIKFYSTVGYYGAFSNFAKYPLTIGGKVWPTSEHWYQAQKFADPIYQEEIRKAPSAKVAAQKGRDKSKGMRPDWDEIKLDIMTDVLWHKFTQHDKLRLLLLSTGSAELIEHTANDSYWGDGGDGSGFNMLGILLMITRAKLLEQS